MRGCIGRPFAWQEALLTTSLLLQNFNFRFHDPSYNLQIQQTLTIKPKNFFMHAALREHIDPIKLEKMLLVDTSIDEIKSEKDGHLNDSKVSMGNRQPMNILYGSNSGTCEALAQSLARAGGSRGFKVECQPLDAVVDKLPKGPLIMISSSYEGKPPDNAAHFVEWLDSLSDDKKFAGIKYAVYGCGNRTSSIPKILHTLYNLFG